MYSYKNKFNPTCEVRSKHFSQDTLFQNRSFQLLNVVHSSSRNHFFLLVVYPSASSGSVGLKVFSVSFTIQDTFTSGLITVIPRFWRPQFWGPSQIGDFLTFSNIFICNLDFGDFNFGDVLLGPKNHQNRGITVPSKNVPYFCRLTITFVYCPDTFLWECNGTTVMPRFW